jgi:hypothetical protein
VSFEDFDGSRGELIDAWASNTLPPRKRRDGSISVEKEREFSTISYAVPIASLWLQSEAPQYAVVGTSDSLSRTSVTTNKHLGEVSRALRRSSQPVWHTVRIIHGMVPFTVEQWQPFLKFFEVVLPPNLSGDAKGLWDLHEQNPYDEGPWLVLRDMYFEAGFGAGIQGITLTLDGFFIGYPLGVGLDPFATGLEIERFRGQGVIVR